MSTTGTHRISGGRTGILLLHGLCGTPAEMRFVANNLARQGYTVHCPQIAGQTGTAAEVGASTWRDWYESAEAALAEIKETCDTVIVGGLSTGAVLSLMLAANHPDTIRGTLLFAPTLWANGWRLAWYSRLFRLVPTKRLANLFGVARRSPYGIKDVRIREFVSNAMAPSGGKQERAVTPGGALFEHRRLVRALFRVIGTVRQPALIVHSREDDYAHLDNAVFLQRRLAAPVDMLVLNDSYHLVTVDRQRHLLAGRAIAFVARLVEELSASGAEAQPIHGRA